MALPIGIQIYSVRDDAKADLRATLKKIKAMGYDGVELAGLYDLSPAEIKKMFDETGLVPISAHVSINDFRADLEGTLAKYKEIGCKFIGIPSLPKENRPGNEKFYEALDELAEIGKTAKKFGIQLLYHNHDFEFVKIGGKYGLDIMYEKVPADLLQTEIDTCWVNVGGAEPAAYVRKYKGRAPVIHLKDFYGDRSGAAYDLIGESGKAPARPEGFEYRPLGKGLQDVPAIIKAAEDAGATWLIVEQDSPSMGLTPMECIETSIQYLKKIGYKKGE